MRVDGDRLPTLSTDRLQLRWLEPGDAEDLFEIFSDPETMKYWSHPPMTELSQAETLVREIHESFEAHRLYEWGVARRTDGRIIGTLTLASLDPKNLRAEIGFAQQRASWGNGFMREAVRAGLRFGFESLGLMRVEADVDPENAASLRLLEDLGFQREGLLRERWRVGGGVQDSVMLGLLRREWDARSESR